MKKMTGAEYKAFMAADWDALFGLTDAYVDGQEVTVNGAEAPCDDDLIPDNAKVVIACGCICANEEVDLSYETAFTRWKKAQTHATLVVQIPNEEVDALHKFLESMKGRVLK